jgi:hypothetical protein
VDYEEVTEVLEKAGVQTVCRTFDELLESNNETRAAGSSPAFEAGPPISRRLKHGIETRRS